MKTKYESYKQYQNFNLILIISCGVVWVTVCLWLLESITLAIILLLFIGLVAYQNHLSEDEFNKINDED